MCGIFGYISHPSLKLRNGKQTGDAAKIIFDGLKRLEYRGYDSWGIAVKDQGKITLEKHVGRIGQAKVNLPKSSLGIGHTRWATHGGVTVANAHPHLDCTGQIAVVHNGIVENFQDLKNELTRKGHKFISETDTEVIPHLIEEFLKKEGFASAVRDTFNRLKGLNAIVVTSAVSPEIIAAKNGSPLVAGIGKEEFFIASDATGIVKHTKKVVFIEDNQMVVLGKSLKLVTLPKGQEIKPVFHDIDWKFEETKKGKFKHYFLKEIYEQPKVLENVVLNQRQNLRKLAGLIDKARGTFLLGCGTASYAALAGTYLFSKLAKKHINYSVGSEFSYLQDFVTPKTLVIPISQSGETIDIVQPVQEVQKKGATIAAITNVLGSTLYRQADYKFLLDAGPEKSVAGTKSFTSMISVLLLTAYILAGAEEDGKRLLLAAAKNLRSMFQVKNINKIKRLARKISRSEHMYLIGRGLSYPAAIEATLKIKEISYIHAEGFAGAELKHGVIALIEKGTPCIIFAPNDETYEEIISNAEELKARGGFIIGIGSKNNNVFNVWLETKDIKEATIIPQVVYAQLLAYYLALERGVEDPDKPRNLAKSVTVK
ncbi:MAG: glutamine--fructose-6-phosphate transaminase (isomerizing) [Candidatus Curtissbacteria bacterium]|nr:glutamine--fructose-6-phosphate transaminase (isomerizing) [Candidatus Curtissbacteria bacterium]